MFCFARKLVTLGPMRPFATTTLICGCAQLAASAGSAAKNAATTVTAATRPRRMVLLASEPREPFNLIRITREICRDRPPVEREAIDEALARLASPAPDPRS